MEIKVNLMILWLKALTVENLMKKLLMRAPACCFEIPNISESLALPAPYMMAYTTRLVLEK